MALPVRHVAPLLAVILGAAGLAQSPGPRQSGPARDTPAQIQATPAPQPSGRIAGRVVAGDTGRPLSGARVQISGSELSRSSATVTDDEGVFEFIGLPEGRYTISAGRPGFVSLSWGQRRPLQPGTPIQLAGNQRLTGIDFRLPRGSVISGRIQDQNGEPLPGSVVRAMRSQYVQGRRELVAAGFAQTDDRGEYRIWGLNPGNYYISAAATPDARGRFDRGGFSSGGGGFPSMPGGPVAASANTEAEALRYAPTYYPGVVSPHEAQPLALGLSAEATGVNLQLLRVRTSVVSGRIVGPRGEAVESGGVMLSPEGQSLRGAGPMFGGRFDRVRDDGMFSIDGVTPGRYILRAFSGGGRDNDSASASASQALAVDGDVSLNLVLAPTGSVGGTVVITGAEAAPDLSQFRISVVPVDGATIGSTPSSRVAQDGTFLVDGVPAGAHLLRGQTPRGWALESATIAGRDVLDAPVTLRSGEHLDTVRVGFTNQLAGISGQVADQSSNPLSDYTVLAFPANDEHWHAQSRHIMTARPDQTGRYQLNGLPPGEYFLAVIDPVEPGEWFERRFLEQHRMGAVQVTVEAGATLVQDFRIATP
ncbi:MAG: collagen binding domain-containing protein [Vicinamibacterales bacterium]